MNCSMIAFFLHFAHCCYCSAEISRILMNEKTFPIREFIFAFLEMKIVHIDIGSSYNS